jgi:hypothetical protein
MLSVKNKTEPKQTQLHKQDTSVIYEKPKLIRSTNEYPPSSPKIILLHTIELKN